MPFTSQILFFLSLVVILSGFHITDEQRVVEPFVPTRGLTADVTGVLGDSFFQKVLTAFLPSLRKYGRSVTIPGETTKHFSFSSFQFSQFNVSAGTIRFVAPTLVRLAVHGVTLAVPPTAFSVYTRVLPIQISCSGSFWISLAPTAISLDLGVSTDANGKLTFSAGPSAVHYGTLSIQHKFRVVACRVAERIVELFIGNLNTLVRNAFEKELPKHIGSLAVSALNPIFAKAPMVVVGNPTVNSQGVTLTIDLIASLQRHRNSFVPGVGRVKRSSPSDLALTIPQASANNLLIYDERHHHLHKTIAVNSKVLNTTSIGKLIPGVLKVCVNCPIDLVLTATMAPQVAFAANSVTLSVQQLNVAFVAISPAKEQLPLFSLNVNLWLGAHNLTIRGNSTNEVLWFQLRLNTFEFTLDQSEVGPIDTHLISPLVEAMLIQVVVPYFNLHFTGVPLPTNVQDVALTVSPGTLVLALNVNIAQEVEAPQQRSVGGLARKAN